ncbi:MAG: lycopene beta-cyclase CrtY [Planctomycetota bacterium]
MSTKDFDYVIVGGGLQGCLVAHALRHRCPDASVLIVERGEELCGNHTWSFHESDVPPASRAWYDPLQTNRWPGYFVKFPGLRKRVEIPYATITSERLRDATAALASDDNGKAPHSSFVVCCRTDCEIVSSRDVTIGDAALSCRAVIDCRGRAATPEQPNGAGFQSFIGREFKTDRRWPVSDPTVMDAREDQEQGFEFLYELPLGSNRVLLEYTRFSETPGCDAARAEALIAERLHEADVGSAELVRTERGCLPMPYAATNNATPASAAGGYAGGWYHAATGYSMPLAIRFAELVANADPEQISADLSAAASRDAWRRTYARFLNRLLFCLVTPRHRWKIFRRFYRVLSEERIARFFAHRFSVTDAARIVIGRPPTGLAPVRFIRSLAPRTGTALP